MSVGLSANPVTLCQQLGRLWASRSAAGYTFADPFGVAAGTAQGSRNIWARALPPAELRANVTPAASIVPGTGVAAEPGSHVRAVAVEVAAYASSGSAALAMLDDLLGVLWPDDEFIEMNSAALGAPTGGVMGQSINSVLGRPAFDNVQKLAPSAAGTPVELWRTPSVPELQQEPTLLHSGTGEPDADPALGGGVAEMTLVFRGHAIQFRGSRTAFGLLYSPAGGEVEIGKGTVTVACVDGLATTLTLAGNVGGGGAGTIVIDLADEDSDTIAELRDTIAAADPEWIISGVNVAVDGVASSKLVCAGVMGEEAIAAPLTLGVWPASA